MFEFLFLVFWAAMACYVYDDAKKRGSSSGGLWAFGTFMLGLFVFPFYLLTRSSLPAYAASQSAMVCPHCGKYGNHGANFCPYCGASYYGT